MSSLRESNRPLFHRLLNKEAVNFKASIGKVLRNGINTSTFAGELACNNPLGSFWPDYVQTANLTILIGEDAEIGGFDRLRVTADGHTIDLDPAYNWILLSGAIDTTAGATNIIKATKVSETEIEYSVIN
jgi:hypothetical protein